MVPKPFAIIGSLIMLLAIAAGSFAGGYVAGRAHAVPAGTAGTGPGQPGTEYAATPVEFDSDLGVFAEAWKLVRDEYYDRARIDPRKMAYAAINGMISTLGDPHTLFSTPEQARISEDALKGSFEGIGVTVEMKDGKLVVVSPLPGSPSERAGIQPGDIIVEADGRDLAGLDLVQAITLIRGPRGTTVHLTIKRSSVPELLHLDVVRDEVRLVSVASRMLDGEVAYISISTFGANTADELKSELQTLLAKHPKGLVLDLRNNPGGLLGVAVDVASQFLSEGVVLYEQTADAERQAFTVKGGGLATGIPMVVLVNKGSASAAEVVAGALQDHGRAKLVGERTYGKDTVQNIYQLSDQSSLRVTAARWYTPKAQDIHEKGLKPDLEVPTDQKGVEAGRDPQLERAKQLLLDSQRGVVSSVVALAP